MRLLLDTHIFIWWADAPEKLSAKTLKFMLDPDNDLVLSVASLWEMQIKVQLGKLKLRRNLSELVQIQQEVNGIQLISISPAHVFMLDELPLIHKDPFDRMIIAQAIIEDLLLVSDDKIFTQYNVNLLRADT